MPDEPNSLAGVPMDQLDRLASELSFSPEIPQYGRANPEQYEEYYMTYRDYAEWFLDAIARLGWKVVITNEQGSQAHSVRP